MTETIRVEGLRSLLRVTDALPKEIAKGIRRELREVAEPVRRETEQELRSYLTSHTRSPRYNAVQHIRYGVSVRKAGTVSVEERIKSKYRGSRKRPKFIELQFEQGLDPVVQRNEPRVLAGFNRVLDGMERRWAVG